MSTLGAAAVGSAVSGGLGIIGSLVNYGLNKRLAEQQNQYNIDMWKMQNEYNSPQAQMQRFAEAGLNPNLIYGQGTSGNASSAPQMVTPSAPELSKEMQKLGEAFNIEGLRTLVAKRKEAQANADNARTNAERNELQLFAEKVFGNKWSYNYKTGRYELRPPDPPGTVTVVHPSAYWHNRILENNYIRAHLIPYRAALYEHNVNYLVPQIRMANYEAEHYPVSYWIGQGSKVLNGLTGVPKIFSPLQWTWKKNIN